MDIKFYFIKDKLHYFSFYTKSEKPIEAVIRHQAKDTPADISTELMDLRLDVINVKDLTATRP
jgi:hypothetical protein